jgi:hypothetical protein
MDRYSCAAVDHALVWRAAFVGDSGDCFVDDMAVGTPAAYRVGARGVAGEGEGLAPASGEIDIPAQA